MGVGRRLKLALREKKMTIKDLAAQSDISLNTLYSITKRDTEKIDEILLDRISSTLDLSWTFFMSCSAFEDLEFLERYKEAILSKLERDDLFSRNGRSFSDIDSYEFWQLLSKYVSDVALDENGCIQLDYYFTSEDYDDLRREKKQAHAAMSRVDPDTSDDVDEWLDGEESPFYIYRADEKAVIQKLLDVFMKLDRYWQKAVIEDAERYLEHQKREK